MTFYLKYRPKTIEELDLTSVRERLLTIVKDKAFAHAYLFCGPRGTGKTSAARLVAQEVGATGVDVIELDAASNRGIDDIRQLRERIGLLPAQSERKAYIIDEVHMLTTEAFNALLKTLEEPPSHAVFFLCTTELEKMPQTVVSRCVLVSFQKATGKELTRSLLRVAAGEKFSITPEAIERISWASDGSFREAHTMLEEALRNSKQRLSKGKSKQEVNLADVNQVIGASFTDSVTRYVEGVVSGDSRLSLDAVNEIVQRGGDVLSLSRAILEDIRRRLLSSPDERLLVVAQVVEERVRTVKYAILPQLSLEIAALELDQTLPGGGSKPAKGDEKASRPTAQPARPSVSAPSILPKASIPAITLEKVIPLWPKILSEVRQKNHGIVALLSHSRPLSVEGNALVIEVEYGFHKEQLEQDRYRRLVEEVCQSVLGDPVLVRFRLGEATKRVLKQFQEDDNIHAVGENDGELIQAAEEMFST